MITFQVKGSVKGQLSEIRKLQQAIAKLPQEAYAEFIKNTPVDTGNARRRTSLKNTVIEADYVYAERLDKGWSNQSPKGMIKPTEAFIKARLKQITGK